MKFINWSKENYLLIIILFMAAALRIYHIDYQSLWMDEIFTINDTNPNYSFLEVYYASYKEGAPPLYFIIVNFIFKIFGYTTFVLRMVSAIFGLAGVLAIYFLGKEILNRNVGIYSALLLAFNYYHIHYSQEARVYAFLFLVTTFSFYMLIRFIKVPTLKSALIYGVSSALMLYGHYFAMFTLIAQYLILLFFVVRPFNITRLKFFFYCFIAGIVALILFLPFNYYVLVAMQEVKSFWIPKPELDVYTDFLKHFFGKSEIVLFFVLALIFIFFVELFKEKDEHKFQLDPNKNKLVFVFVVLFNWILITLLIPLIRSYTIVPMLQNRYFMGILPAVVLMVSIGLFYVRSGIVRYGIVLFVIIFSLTDIVIVKQYYTKPSKDQFREVSQFIIDNNRNNEPVVSNLGWFLPFYLNNEKVKSTIVNSPLEDFVQVMIKDSTKRTSFWYTDGGVSSKLNISEDVKKYLNDNFTIENNADLHAMWTIHYSLSAMPLEEVDILKFKPLKEKNGDEFIHHLDNFNVTSDVINLEGFAFFNDQDATNTKMEFVVIQNQQAFKLQHLKFSRGDLAPYFKSKYDLANAGFTSSTIINKLKPGDYQLGIILTDKTTNKEGLALCDNFFTKK